MKPMRKPPSFYPPCGVTWLQQEKFDPLWDVAEALEWSVEDYASWDGKNYTVYFGSNGAGYGGLN